MDTGNNIKHKPPQRTILILMILAGIFIVCPNSLLLREDVPARYDDIAPIVANGFLTIGIALIIIGIIRLLTDFRR